MKYISDYANFPDWPIPMTSKAVQPPPLVHVTDCALQKNHSQREKKRIAMQLLKCP